MYQHGDVQFYARVLFVLQCQEEDAPVSQCILLYQRSAAKKSRVLRHLGLEGQRGCRSVRHALRLRDTLSPLRGMQRQHLEEGLGITHVVDRLPAATIHSHNKLFYKSRMEIYEQ